MLKFVAVDPSIPALGLVECKQLLMHFGVDQARIISEYPAGWRDSFYRAAETRKNEGKIGDVQLQAMKRYYELRAKKKMLLPEMRTFEQTKAWAENARAANGTRPFDAVIATEAHDAPNWIAVDLGLRDGQESIVAQLDFESGCLSAERQRFVLRSADGILSAAASILSNSRQILFVDPYFDPLAERCREPLKQLLEFVSRAGVKPSRLEYHSMKKGEKTLPPERWEKAGATKELARIIPKGMAVRFQVWSERDGGQEFHARYILTEHAGIKFDQGLQESNEAQREASMQQVDLVEEHIRSEVWSWYFMESKTFERVGGPIVVKSAR